MNELLTVTEAGISGSWQWVAGASIAGTTVVAVVVAKLGEIMKGINAFRAEWAKMHKPKKHDYAKQGKMEADVTNHLRVIKHDLQCDRVLIMQLHNGIHSIARVPFLRYSCTHEQLSKGTDSIMQLLQNINANLYGSWNVDVFDGKNICYPKVHDISTSDPSLAGAEQFIAAHGVQSIYIFPLQDAYGKTYGAGIIEFCREERNLEVEWLKWTHSRFLAIGAILAGFAEPEYGELED
jgi:hypothetical protein